MTDPDLQKLIQSLREIRTTQRLSLRAVAERMGLKSHRHLTSLESGETNITFKTLSAYANALGVKLKMEVQNMPTVSFYNHAGGSGKSVLTRDMSYAFAQRGLKVLAIDMDAQANLTSFFGLDPDELADSETIMAAIMDLEGVPKRHLPTPKNIYGVDIIPAKLSLARADHVLLTETLGTLNLATMLQPVTGYDVIMIDCPPNLGAMSNTAMLASEFVVIPVQLRRKFRDGLYTVLENIEKTSRHRPHLRPLAVVPTQTDDTVVSRKNSQHLMSNIHPNPPVLSPISRRPAVYGEAEEHSKPVALHAPNSDAAQDLETVADELLALLNVKVTA